RQLHLAANQAMAMAQVAAERQVAMDAQRCLVCRVDRGITTGFKQTVVLSEHYPAHGQVAPGPDSGLFDIALNFDVLIGLDAETRDHVATDPHAPDELDVANAVVHMSWNLD